MATLNGQQIIALMTKGHLTKTQEKTVIQNGVVGPDEGYDALSKVNVSVLDLSDTRVQEKTITENGVYYPDEGYNVFSKVTVNIPTYITVPTIDDIADLDPAEDGTILLIGTSGSYTRAYERIGSVWMVIGNGGTEKPGVTKLATPIIRLVTESNSDNTTAVLGQAILGQAILGSVGTDLVKLDTPVIRLEEVSDLVKLATPVIRLEEEEEVTGVTLSITFPAVSGTTDGYGAIGSTYFHSLAAKTSYSGYDAYSTCVIDGVTIGTTNTVVSSSKISTDTTIYRKATFSNGVLTIITDASKTTSDSTPVEVSADAYTTTAVFSK